MGPCHTDINKFQPKQSPELAISRDLRRKRGPLDQSRGEETGVSFSPLRKRKSLSRAFYKPESFGKAE